MSTLATSVAEKRAALLESALELFARHGLQGVSTSAIAKKAGVAKGTLFVHFETKEALLNELYLEVASRYVDAMRTAFDATAIDQEGLRPFWFAFARWYFAHGDAATFMLQCEVSSVLTPETQAQKAEMEAEMATAFFPDLPERTAADASARFVGYALVAGPIQVLAQMRDKGEIRITNELLEQTFKRVERALMPPK